MNNVKPVFFSTESYMDSSEQNRKVLSLYLKGPFYRHNNETDFDIKVSLAEGLDKKTKDGDKYLSESVTETVTDDKVIGMFNADDKLIFFFFFFFFS